MLLRMLKIQELQEPTLAQAQMLINSLQAFILAQAAFLALAQALAFKEQPLQPLEDNMDNQSLMDLKVDHKVLPMELQALQELLKPL